MLRRLLKKRIFNFLLVFSPLFSFYNYAQTVYTLGSGTSTSTSYGLVPINTYYHDSRSSYVIRASELTAAGASAGIISALGLYVSQQPGRDMSNFTIRLKHTASTTASGFDGTGTIVYSANPQLITALTSGGWRTFTFGTNFTWNGTSNLLVEICFDNTNWTSGGGVRIYNPGSYTASAYNFVDSGTGCSLGTGGNYATSQDRPQFQFTIMSAPIPTLSNYAADGTLSTGFAHRRSGVSKPKFTLSASSSYNAVQIELNTLSDFSGTAYTTTINEGTTYNGSTLYDFWTTEALTADRTFFVRARLSSNGGSTWGQWSSGLWPYSYYPSTPYPEDGWYYTTQEQFQTGVVQETLYNYLNISNNSTSFPDDDNFSVNQGSFNVNTASDDGVRENGVWYPSENYMTIGWQNDCNGNAAIYDGFPFALNIPQGANILTSNFSVVATTACVCESQSVAMRLIMDAHYVDNGPTLSSANVLSLTTPTRTTQKEYLNYTTSWANNTRYTMSTNTSILQEVVNRSGWTAGNRFNFMMYWDAAYTPGTDNNRCIRQSDNGAATAPNLTGTFTNFYNTVRFPNVNRNIYGPAATSWDELRVTDNTVGCGTCYVEYRIHNASNDAVVAGPFLRSAGLSGAQYFDISGVAVQTIYVTTRVYRNSSPVVHDIWLTTNTPSPLPVSLSNVVLTCEDDVNVIKWTTLSEQNTLSFDIERSRNNENWNNIGSVPAFLNSTTEKNYQFVDDAPLNSEVSYYRLRQIDLDGREVVLGPWVMNCSPGLSFSVNPNPNNGNFALNIQIEKLVNSKIDMQLIDVSGKIIQQKELKLHAGNNNFILSDLNLSKGTYLIMLKVNDELQKPLRFVVE